MAIEINSLNYFTENLVKFKPLEEWETYNASVSASGAVIEPGGLIRTVIERLPEETDKEETTPPSETEPTEPEKPTEPTEPEEPEELVLSSSKYIKLGIDLTDSPENENRYKSNLHIFIRDEYLLEESDFNKTITRELCINTMNTSTQGSVSSGPYHSVHLLSMFGKPLKRMHIEILNDTDTTQTITWLGLFASNDIGYQQYNQIQKQTMVKIGTYIEPRTDDPVDAEIGRIWLRMDIQVPTT